MGHREGRNEAVRLGSAERGVVWMGGGGLGAAARAGVDSGACSGMLRPIRERRRRASSTVPPRASIYALVIVVRWTHKVGRKSRSCTLAQSPLGRYSLPPTQVSRTTPGSCSIASTVPHPHTSTPHRHNHGPDRTQGADRRRAAGALLSLCPLTTRSPRNA